MNIIKHTTRPNLHNLDENKLLNIIKSTGKYDENVDKFETRSEMVDKIFKLWSENELVDHLEKSIECLICCDPLTNGNNLTFECGHKFHSTCVIKHVLVFSTDLYSEYVKDNEKKSVKIEYCCPQCKLSIESINCIKDINN